eukprot:6480161-Pyramimonas_sp.AAC.1
MNALRVLVKIVAEPDLRAFWSAFLMWWYAHRDEPDESQLHSLRSTDGPRSFFLLFKTIVTVPLSHDTLE